jgi:SMODS and SLOG-associating 2TM effector domain 1
VSPGDAALAGRIAFRVRIGVTGHRTSGLERKLDDLFDRIRRLLPELETTPVRLAVVSALAEGADRVVVDEVFDYAAGRGEEARLEVVLPFDSERYAELQAFTGAAEAQFRDRLSRATSITQLGGSASAPAAAYEAVGQYVVNRCDVLIALWDGQPTGGRGGTAETLLYATEVGKPCIWIPTEESAPCLDNFTDAPRFQDEVRRRAAVTGERSGDMRRTHVTKPLEDMFRELDEFNRPPTPVPPAKEFQGRLDRELGALDETSEWVAGPLMRASVLANRYQRRFVQATWLMSGLATGAAACLGASVALDHPSPGWAWAEVGCLLALVVVFLLTQRLRLHRRWLSYRVLAERLRSAHFVAPTGIDFSRTAGLETVFVERRSADWILRAFEEVWDSRPDAVGPRPTLADEEVEELRATLADQWIAGQIDYHARARRRHERRAFVLAAFILALFAGALLFAVLHAAHIAEGPATLLSVTLPIAAAAVGVILTVRQHHALAERYRRMHSDLEAVRRALREADSQTIGKTAAEAARIIAEENGDWFGVLWFLDVEHPP